MAIAAWRPQPSRSSDAVALLPAQEGPVWSLDDLYTGPDDPRINADLASVERDAAELEAEFKGRLAGLDGNRLADMIERYEAVEDRLGRAMSYAQLLFAAQRDDPTVGRFYQGIQE